MPKLIHLKGAMEAIVILIIELIHMSQLNKPCNCGALLYWSTVKGNLHQQGLKMNEISVSENV